MKDSWSGKEVTEYVVGIISHRGSNVGSRLLDGLGDEKRKRRWQNGVKTDRKKAYDPGKVWFIDVMNDNLKGALRGSKGRIAEGRLAPLTVVKERRPYGPIASSFQLSNGEEIKMTQNKQSTNARSAATRSKFKSIGHWVRVTVSILTFGFVFPHSFTEENDIRKWEVNKAKVKKRSRKPDVRRDGIDWFRLIGLLDRGVWRRLSSKTVDFYP